MVEGEHEMDQKKIVIYTENWRLRCWLAKRLLKRKGYQFEVVDLTNDSEGRAWLAQTTGQRMVPQVFIEGLPVGDVDDIRVLDRSGGLDRLVRGA
jgi:glutaredoxin 3